MTLYKGSLRPDAGERSLQEGDQLCKGPEAARPGWRARWVRESYDTEDGSRRQQEVVYKMCSVTQVKPFSNWTLPSLPGQARE